MYSYKVKLTANLRNGKGLIGTMLADIGDDTSTTITLEIPRQINKVHINIVM